MFGSSNKINLMIYVCYHTVACTSIGLLFCQHLCVSMVQYRLGGGGMHKDPNRTFPPQQCCNQRKNFVRRRGRMGKSPPPPGGLCKMGRREGGLEGAAG